MAPNNIRFTMSSFQEMIAYQQENTVHDEDKLSINKYTPYIKGARRKHKHVKKTHGRYQKDSDWTSGNEKYNVWDYMQYTLDGTNRGTDNEKRITELKFAL